MQTLKEIILGFFVAYGLTCLVTPGLALVVKAVGYPQTSRLMLDVVATLVFL